MIQVDPSQLEHADKRIKKVSDLWAARFATAAGAMAAAGAGAFALAQKASAANEVVNAIGTTFKEGSHEVLAWADNAAKAMGRSRFEMRAAANDFGKILAPTFQGSNGQLVEMSTTLAQLATDLGSFHDISDQEAAMKLRSGIMGETEAVRSLGIDISDESLDNFAAQMNFGGGTRVRDMDMATKMQLRYAKSLKDTAAAQNDSIRTQFGWANSLKRVQGRFDEIMTELGEKFIANWLPVLQKLPVFLEKIDDLINGTTALDSAFILLTGAAITAAIAWIALNPVAALIGAVAINLFLIFDEMVALFTGATSVIGTFIEEVFGVQDATRMMQNAWHHVIDAFMAVPSMFVDIWNNLKYVLSGGSSGYEGLQATRKNTDDRQAAREEETFQERLNAAKLGQSDAFQNTFTQKERDTNFAMIEEMWYQLRQQAILEAQEKGTGVGSHNETDALVLGRMGLSELPMAGQSQEQINAALGVQSAVNGKAGGASAPGAPGGVQVNVTVGQVNESSPEQLQALVVDGVRQAMTEQMESSAAGYTEGAYSE